MKIITVCTMGIGTSILLKMNVETALEKLGVSGSVEASDLGSARGAAQAADIIMTNAEMARVLGDLASPVAVIANFMDTDEIMRAVRAVMEKP